MRKRMSALLMVVGLMLALASPALAQTVQVGNQVAGPLSENVTVAGDAALLNTPAPDLPWGTDIAVTGNPIPPNAYAEGVNFPFEFNQAVAGVGALEDDVFAVNVFFGPNIAETGWGNLSIDIED